MSQQINLLNTALIKQKDLLNVNNIAITLGLLSVLMISYYVYAQKQLSLLTMQHKQVAEELVAVQAQLKQTALLHAPRALNKTLQDEMMQLEKKEAIQQQILQMLNLSSATTEKGYAALMRAFAKQRVDGLWLTGFSIDSRTEQLNISGRALQADIIPEYIARLGNESVLKGKLFSTLSIIQPKKSSLPNANTSAPVLTTTTGSAIAASKVQTTEPQFIEFSLQSIDKKIDMPAVSDMKPEASPENNGENP
jgi:hypothetical protein